ncbi:protein ZW2-like [Malania oleifera]|uniref:protein ZW2-like n=1 Tax=Malania oleifera TaxID=397392 RepID=UPI0025AE1F20|nr:protein ZW2-like [Malania oleifera]
MIVSVCSFPEFLYCTTMSAGSVSSGNHASSFEAFFEAWLVRQAHYLDELLHVQLNLHESSEHDLNDLVSRVLAHYQQYYAEKSIDCHRDVFVHFSRTCFSSFEQSFFWIAGFKPGLAFRLVADSVGDLSEEQNRKIGVLREETRAAERALAEELARVQESVAAPPLLKAARQAERGGRMGQAEEMVGSVRVAMERVVGRADALRMRTTARVVEILTAAQNVRFLAAATQLQTKIRAWGLEKDGERGRNR